MTQIKQFKNSSVIATDLGVFYFPVASTSNQWSELTIGTNVSWESAHQTVQGKKIVPYGSANDLPVMIRRIMDRNSLAPGILEREMGLLRGQGAQLYTTVIENGDVTRKWTYDQEIWDWLNSWNFRQYIDKATTEYKYLKGFFVKRTMKRGNRIGRRPEWKNIEVIPATDCRLSWVDSRRLEDVENIYVGDFENGCSTGIRTYPVYNHEMPWAKAVCMSYHNTYSFARNFYSVPGYFGTLNWIERSSDIPELIKYLTDNSLSLTYHVHSPSGYWQKKRELLEDKYPDKDSLFIDKKLEDVKTEVFKSMTETLSGKKNAGKFIETVDFFDSDANTVVSWKIEPIDQKFKEFIDAQLEVSKKADAATTSGIGLHPALSNIMVDGKLSSGSEMLYALKLYLASDTNIPEEVILEPINQAIQTMFPNSKKRIGFYHKIVLREESVTPGERTANNV